MNRSKWLGLIGLLVLVVVVQCGGSASPHDPVRIRIPAIGVDASVQSLTVDQSGVLPPPDSYDVTGWWREGPEPGERGPAVIAGHVDSVFFRLTDLGGGTESSWTARTAPQRCSPRSVSSDMTRTLSRQTRCTETRRIHSCA